MSGPQRVFDVFVIGFACAIGGAIHFSFQRGVRRNYLAKQVLSESANRDSLTGIHNRRMFDDHMQRLWQQALRERVPLALLLVDLDHFKAFNDRRGHQAGDACLAKVANVLPVAARRPFDLAARYGGEEFAVLLYDASRDRVEEMCRQLHASSAEGGARTSRIARQPLRDFQHRRGLRRADARTPSRRLHPARRRGAVRGEGTRPQPHGDHGSGIRDAHYRCIPDPTRTRRSRLSVRQPHQTPLDATLPSAVLSFGLRSQAREARAHG